MSKLLNTAACAIALLSAAPAIGETLHVSSVHSSIFGDENGGSKWYVSSAMQVGTQSFDRVAAGAFRLQSEDASGAIQRFLAFCLQPLEGLELPRDYEIDSRFAPQQTADLNALASFAMEQVVDGTSAAAFQMAAWEITTETAGYDIDAGFFQMTGTSAGSDAAEILAQGWLDNITNGSWTATPGDYMILKADGIQDLLTDVAPVPLPASAVLLLCALGGLGATRTSRSSVAKP